MNATTVTENRVEKPAERAHYLTPPVDIFETPDAYLLEAEMPGVNKQGLEVLLEKNTLTIVGHRNLNIPDANRLCRESQAADYRRVFALDPAIDTARINAQMAQGVLTLRLPKSEQVKPRKIAVTD